MNFEHMTWWNNLSFADKTFLCKTTKIEVIQNRNPDTLTGREIKLLYLETNNKTND